MTSLKFGIVYWIATASLVMYSILFLASVYQYARHRRINEKRTKSNFNQCKLTFFAVLAISSAASIPLWVACVAYGGPDDCQWDGAGYAVCWSLHLIALTGFSCCVGIPTIMWSDIVNGYDHKSFLKSFCDWNIDSTRVCFLVFAFCYILNELLTVISMIVWMDPSDAEKYLEGNEVYGIGTFIEPIIICLFAGGCLVIGIRLQLYVRRVRLSANTQRRLLWQLNSVLTVVTLSYLTRAAFIFNLRSHYNDNIFNCSYAVWIVCTHWLPHVLCSLCLLLIMSRAGTHGYCCCWWGHAVEYEEVDAKEGWAREKGSPSRGRGKKRQGGRRHRSRSKERIQSRRVFSTSVDSGGEEALDAPLLGADAECEQGDSEGYDNDFDYEYDDDDDSGEGSSSYMNEEEEEWEEDLMMGGNGREDEEADNEDSFRDSYRTDYVDSEYDVNIALYDNVRV
jgi:hypothetical protein